MILKQGHTYRAMPHDGKLIAYIYRGGRCYYIASPYSPEATQALKAAFPQYFAEICDYGYAHPALVPFVNEDPMLIVSLVEVGKTRWLVGDGKAYVESGVTPNNTSSIDITFRRTEASQTSQYGLGAPFGIRNPNALGFTVVTDPVAYYAKFGGTQVTDIGDPRNTNTHNVKMSAEGTFYDGVQKMSAVSQTFTITGTYILFGWVDATTKKFAVPYAIKQAHYKDSSIEQDFIPMQRTDGTCGMLDIVSLTFYPNANTEGAFTIEVTDKA